MRARIARNALVFKTDRDSKRAGSTTRFAATTVGYGGAQFFALAWTLLQPAGSQAKSSRKIVPAVIWTTLLLAAVCGSVLIQIFSERSGATAAISGFFLVFCGTLLVARLSHSPEALRRLSESLRALRRVREQAAAPVTIP